MMPLENIRIADFTTMLAGAGVCRELADLGADVIKIEPIDGDSWRMLAGGFMGVNRGKRGIVIDLRKEEARSIAYKLIATCDMVVENSRPGIMKKLGMDYETVKKIKPDILYVSMPAFGSKGPDAERPGYDPLFQAMSGQMSGQGGPGKTPVFHKISRTTRWALCWAPSARLWPSSTSCAQDMDSLWRHPCCARPSPCSRATSSSIGE